MSDPIEWRDFLRCPECGNEDVKATFYSSPWRSVKIVCPECGAEGWR